MSDELDRQKAINLELRRKLEKVRRETVEYCAKFCEDHALHHKGEDSFYIRPAAKSRSYYTIGDCYAHALRGIIRK
jgi:hypothetical protein